MTSETVYYTLTMNTDQASALHGLMAAHPPRPGAVVSLAAASMLPGTTVGVRYVDRDWATVSAALDADGGIDVSVEATRRTCAVCGEREGRAIYGWKCQECFEAQRLEREDAG